MLNFLQTDPVYFVLWIAAVIYGITVHEFSHVLAAYLQGDDTGKLMGRLTLNPLVHIDWIGFAMLLVVGFGWGNPAPYNPYNLKYKKWGSAIVSFAGPLSNIISLVVFGAVFRYLHSYTSLSSDNLLFQFLLLLVVVNVVLLVFNLIPIPPLDGAKILFTILPESFNEFKYQLAKNGPIILIGLLLIDNFIPGLSLFGGLFSWALNIVYRFL